MKIKDAINKPVSLDAERLGTSTGKKTEKTQSGSKSVENVTLSPLSTQLQTLEASVASDNVFDAGKVDAIKSAIANGQFKVDSGKVADGLIATVKDLLTAKKP